MPRFTFTSAAPVSHRDALIDINIEYVSWVANEIERAFGISPQGLVGMDIPQYVSSVIEKVCGEPPPSGAFYLIHAGSELAGMGGLRRIGDGVAEIKRIYVRPAYRGLKLGRSILERLLADAREFGYRNICLDTAPFMQSAQRLYEAAGFVDRQPYEGVEVPPVLHSAWRFMERVV
jgi:ribosomal protein S18 acetylase RimI-like enzyme